MPAAEGFDGVCVVRREFAWPLTVVYRAWTDPDMIAQWSWGRQYTTISVELDCQVGGAYRAQVRDKQTGENWFFDAVFQEVQPFKKLVHTFQWRSDGGYTHGPTLVSIEFVDHGVRTELIITHSQLPNVEERQGTVSGWIDVCDCIAKCLGEQLAVAKV